jgi:hypothetical protein
VAVRRVPFAGCVGSAVSHRPALHGERCVAGGAAGDSYDSAHAEFARIDSK